MRDLLTYIQCGWQWFSHSQAKQQNKQDAKQQYEQYVKQLITINSGKVFEVWKYCEDNADRSKSTLWDQGKWLLTFQGGALFLPFTAKLIKTTSYFPFVTTNELFLVILIYLFGIILSIYSLVFQGEVGEHIARNFDRAIYAREGKIPALSPPHYIPILRVATWCLIAAFSLVLLVLLLLEFTSTDPQIPIKPRDFGVIT